MRERRAFYGLAEPEPGTSAFEPEELGVREGGLIKSHRDLRVYQEAFALSSEIFEATKQFPPEERFSLSDQVRRSSRSVTAALAEAWRKRRYKAAFISKLNEAESEAAETQSWLEHAAACGYMGSEPSEALIARYEGLIGALVRMAKTAEDWTR